MKIHCSTSTRIHFRW